MIAPADVGALVSSSYQKKSSLLTLLNSLGNEEEFGAWSEILVRFGNLCCAWAFQDSCILDALKALNRTLVSTKAHAKGWAFADTEYRVEALFKAHWACRDGR